MMSISDVGVPEGVVPIFLSSKTQEIFHCRCDEDVTEENPIKIITKQEILDDMRNRAAVCDFHPIKQEVIVSQILTTLSAPVVSSLFILYPIKKTLS